MFTVHRITSDKEFHDISTEWNDLLRRSSSDSVFLTWEWLYTWWKYYRQDAELFVLTVRDSTNELVGIAPLLLTPKRHLGIPLYRVIRFLGSQSQPCSDYLDFIVLAGEEKEILATVFNYLFAHSREWHMLELSDITESSQNLAVIRDLQRDFGLKVDFQDEESCPYIPLPHTWEAHLSALSGNFRHQIRKSLRDLRDKVGAEFMKLDDSEGLSVAVDTLVDLNKQRMEQKQECSSFSNPTFCAFLKEVARLFQQNHWLQLCCLKVNGTTVATMMNYIYGNKCYYYQAGFDPRWAKYRPGIVLFAEVIHDSIEAGLTEFDFLRGDEPYKYRWTAHRRVKLEVKAGNSNLLSRGFCFSRSFIGRIRQIGRTLR